MFYLKTWKITKVESGCFPPPTMMKCREIIAGTGLAGAAQAAASVKKGSVFHFTSKFSRRRQANQHILCDMLVCQTIPEPDHRGGVIS